MNFCGRCHCAACLDDEIRCADCSIDISDLSEAHQKALRMFAEKFRRGAKEHGDLKKGRNNKKDMIEELVDCAFYGIFELLDMMDE